MSKQIGSIEIKYSKNGIMLKDGKNMLVIPMDKVDEIVETLIDLMSLWIRRKLKKNLDRMSICFH